MFYFFFLHDFLQSVDYKGIKTSEEFEKYKKLTKELVRVDLTKASREEKLAFFINVYNSLVIHANIAYGPPTSLWGRYKVCLIFYFCSAISNKVIQKCF